MRFQGNQAVQPDNDCIRVCTGTRPLRPLTSKWKPLVVLLLVCLPHPIVDFISDKFIELQL